MSRDIACLGSVSRKIASWSLISDDEATSDTFKVSIRSYMPSRLLCLSGLISEQTFATIENQIKLIVPREMKIEFNE